MSPETTDKKRRVNAKQFLADFRSGMTGEDLMRTHGLTQRNLEKIIAALEEKGMLDSADLKLSPKPPAAEKTRPSPVVPPRVEQFPESAPVGVWTETPPKPSGSSCPQCGARVSTRALICPECGHVLSGEERWEQAGTKRPWTERIHPLILVTLVALPVAVALFFFFKDFMLPASKAGMDKRIEALQREIPAGKTAKEAAKDMAREVAVTALETEVRNLIMQEILAGVDENYATFTAGPRWNQFSQSVLTIHLGNIRAYLLKADLSVDFEVVDGEGRKLARVREDSIILEGSTGLEAPLGQAPGIEPPPETGSRPPELPGRPFLPSPSAVREQLKQFQLPQQPGLPPDD